MWLLENFRICLELYWTVLLLVILMGAVQGPLIEHSGICQLGARVYMGKEPPNMKKQPLLSLN